MKNQQRLVSAEPSLGLCWPGGLAQDASPFARSPDFSGASAAQARVKPLHLHQVLLLSKSIKISGFFPPPRLKPGGKGCWRGCPREGRARDLFLAGCSSQRARSLCLALLQNRFAREQQVVKAFNDSSPPRPCSPGREEGSAPAAAPSGAGQLRGYPRVCSVAGLGPA